MKSGGSRVGLFVYGTGRVASKIEKCLDQYNISLEGYLDSYKTGEFMGKSIVNISDVGPEDAVIIAVLNTNSILEIYSFLRKHGIRKIYWFYDAYLNNPSGDFLEDQCLDMSGWGLSIMPHIELHISDKCNLNCKGCTHFSPLFNEVNAVFEEKIKDLRKIKELFDEIFRIDILGGEPLLNPELKDYVVTIRKYLPRTFIQIYTNGILIPKLEDDVFKAIHDANIGISISEYLPTHKMIDQIKEKLNFFNIRYHIAEYDDKQVFNKPISVSKNTKYPLRCISDGCITISDGKIARCPTLMYIKKFNEYFGQNLPTEGIYSIEEYTDGATLLEDMKKEVPLCRHCIKCDMAWSVCDKEIKIEDFAVYE